MEQVVAIEQLLHAVNTSLGFGEIAHQFVGIRVKATVAIGVGVDSEHSTS